MCLTTDLTTYTTTIKYLSGCSAVDSAPHLGCGGREFEPRHSDQANESELKKFGLVF